LLVGATDVLGLHHAQQLRMAILAYGPMAPVVFVVLYVIGGLAFVPGFVLTLLGGLIFGPWHGLVYASIGSTLGACVAFLIARYAARSLVEAWVAKRPSLQRLDAGVVRHGFRIVMLTRLVPMLPFGVLNYAYGVTGIRFVTYAVTSWACMLPATMVLTFTAGGVTGGAGDWRRTLTWVAVAGVLFVLLSLGRGRLARRNAALRELRGER
jgi:uncharacterized membrane protein YdjX (TVP38/TMEM64 family)